MRIVTKHFGFWAGRDFMQWPPGRRWRNWGLRIGFVHDGEPNRWYKYGAGIDIQLVPNFIWWQDLIRQDPRVAEVQVHYRIVGIQNWPFMRFCGGRC